MSLSGKPIMVRYLLAFISFTANDRDPVQTDRMLAWLRLELPASECWPGFVEGNDSNSVELPEELNEIMQNWCSTFAQGTAEVLWGRLVRRIPIWKVGQKVF